MKVGHLSADTFLLSLKNSLGMLQYGIHRYLSANIAAGAINVNISCFLKN
jgi:ethanolamine transporter EutH